MRPGDDVDPVPEPAVAVCTLTDRALAAAISQAPGVGVAGPLLTANLGITQIVRAVLDRPQIGVLLVCGQDSPLFKAGASLIALHENGVAGTDRRIIGAPGYAPVLPAVTPSEVAAFRRQIEVVDLRGERDLDRLRAFSAELARRAADPLATDRRAADPLAADRRAAGRGRAGPACPSGSAHQFIPLRPGGRREPIASAGEGFFVVRLDRADRKIILEHYWPDFRPGHQMRGVRAESMMLGLINAGLLGCLSHAGYLGMELAKAETALRLGLDYEQDRPVRSSAGQVRLRSEPQ